MTMRLPPPLTALCTAIVMVLTRSCVHLVRVSFPLQGVAGAGLALAGVMLAVFSFRAFQRAKTTVSPIHMDQASALVTTGTYAITRNPMYAGLFLMLTGLLIFLGELANIIFPLIFAVIITWTQILPEECVLRGLFGEAYTAYCRRVRRWL